MLPRIKTILPDPLTSEEDGIFAALVSKGDKMSWLSASDAKQLDLDYIYSHSGDKTISPLVAKLLQKEDDGETVDLVDQLASYLYLKFADNWMRTYEAYAEEYKPLENYSMEESESESGKGSEKGDGNTSTSSKVTTSTSAEGGMYGFNSASSVPTDTSKGESTTSGSADDNVETSSSYSSREDARDRTLTRHGNIGVTTSQQMLQSELDLRAYDFIERIFKDCDSVMTLSIYQQEDTL